MAKWKTIPGIWDASGGTSDEPELGPIAVNRYNAPLKCPYCHARLHESDDYGFGLEKYYCPRCGRTIFAFEVEGR